MAEKIIFGISYQKDGREFVPPPGSPYPDQIEHLVLEPRDMHERIPDFVRRKVVSILTKHNIETDGLAILSYVRS